ncbi:GH19644 [Drosophila grimshawi]|uniref:GH19644 n=2 Tax=Drosophila grimshawi TaxID=7222 RepID=B4K2Y2_DROGR|nr:GH19644 [Drosophila grimshawi]
MYKKLRKMLPPMRPLHWFLLALCIFVTFYWLVELRLKQAIKPLSNMAGNGATQAAQSSQSSLAQIAPTLDNFNYEEQLVVLYNRVPKTGSTSFVNIAYDLCKQNRYHVLHINVTANMHVLSLPNQISFVRNVTRWHEMKPALYHGHMAFLDFSK